jgi:hypothetical protein
MSLRDAAAALGMSKSELHRWTQLATLPAAEFERRLSAQTARIGAGGPRVSAQSILADGPVPTRGRVERALSALRALDDDELLLVLESVAAERSGNR